MKPLVFLPTSLCVPATMESAEDLKELFQIYELSLTVKSKPMQLPTLLRKWKRDNWMRVLCSRISSNFHFENYVEELPSCQQVFPANPSPVLGSDKQLKTPDTSGLGSQMELALCVQNTASLKMSQGSSVQPPQMENRYSSMSSETWNKEVIDARGVYSVRKKLALHTKGNEFSSWGTPKEQDSRAASWGRGKSNLGEQVHGMAKNYPTPRARDWKDTPGCAPSKVGDVSLPRMIYQNKNWATPVVGDSVNAKQGDCTNRKRNPGQTLCDQMSGPPAPEKSSTSGKNHGSPKLNPNWVEQLMGLSTGWTDLGSWEMELSPKPQN